MWNKMYFFSMGKPLTRSSLCALVWNSDSVSVL